MSSFVLPSAISVAHDVLGQLLAADRLPDHEAAARLLGRLPGRAAEALGVLDQVALAAARADDVEVAALEAQRLGRQVAQVRDRLLRELRDVAHERLAAAAGALDVEQAVLPVAGQARARELVLAQQVDDLDALAGRLQAAAVAHDVADVDQALDDGCARGGRADARVLHGLAQLVVLDELAGALHGGQQRGLAVARRRLGLARVGGDLGAAHRLALVERRQLLIGALVLVALDALGLLLVRAAPRRRRRASRPRA